MAQNYSKAQNLDFELVLGSLMEYHLVVHWVLRILKVHHLGSLMVFHLMMVH